MWYAIITQDVKNSLEGRKTHRAAHLERLRELVALAEESIPECVGREQLINEVRRESAAFVSLTAGSRAAA